MPFGVNWVMPNWLVAAESALLPLLLPFIPSPLHTHKACIKMQTLLRLFYLIWFRWQQHLRQQAAAAAAFPRPSFLTRKLARHISYSTHTHTNGCTLSLSESEGTSPVDMKNAFWLITEPRKCLFNKWNSCIYISFILLLFQREREREGGRAEEGEASCC